MRSAAVLLLLAATGCGGYAGGGAVPSPVPAMRPEDRVLYGDFSGVQAIATAPDRLYLVYPGAVVMADPLSGRADVPRAAPGERALSQVTMAAVDALDRSLWLAAGQEWFHFDPVADRWNRGAAPGRIRRMAVEGPGGTGVWLDLGGRWLHLDRLGAEVLPPPSTLQPIPTLEDAYREEPALRALAGTIGIGPGMEIGRITAAARAGNGIGWYVGTELRGAFHTTGTMIDPEWLTIGLPAPAVGALAAAGDVVWVATDRGPRGASALLTALPVDGGFSRVHEGDPAFGLGVNAVRRLLVERDTVWMAAEDGVVAVPVNGDRPVRIRTGGPRVSALVRWGGDLVAGTAYGVELVGGAGETARRAVRGASRPVLALHPAGDTLWVGTDRGLSVIVRGDSVETVPRSWREVGGSIVPVTGVGQVGDTVVVLTAERLHWRDPATGSWQLDPPPGFPGPLRHLLIHRGTVWVGGDGGVAAVRLGAGAGFPLDVGRDLPGPPTALAASDEYLWVGTRQGAMRVRVW